MSRRSVWVWRVAAAVLAVVLASVLGARGVPVPSSVLLVVVVAVGLVGGPLHGVLVGLLGGWVADVAPPGTDVLGVSALTHAVAGWLAGRATRVSGWPLWWPPVVTAGGWGIITSVPLLRALASGAPVDVPGLLADLALTALLALVAVPLLIAIDRRIAGRRPR